MERERNRTEKQGSAEECGDVEIIVEKLCEYSGKQFGRPASHAIPKLIS
jgi:hypothetical protein